MADGPLNLSPNFEARFSRIDITRAAQQSLEASDQPQAAKPLPLPKSPRKKYPSHIFPSDSVITATPTSNIASNLTRSHYNSPPTPSKSPTLSTARRAESRSKTRVASSSSSAETGPRRTISKPKAKSRVSSTSGYNNDAKAQSFSFMRETTASSSKKNVDDVSANFKRTFSGPGARKPSRAPPTIPPPPLPHSSSHKQINALKMYGRRVASHTPTNGYKPSIPCDITNTTSNSNTRHSQGHNEHKLQYPNIHGQGNGNIYGHRLASLSSLGPAQTLQPPAPRMGLPALKSQNFLDSPSNASSNDVYDRLYNNSYKRKVSSVSSPMKEPPATKVLHRSTSSSNLHASISKVLTLGELYSIINQQDPSLFRESSMTGMDCDGNDMEIDSNFVTAPSLSAEDIGSADSDSSLSIYERGEILRRKDIYYIPNRGIHGTLPQAQQNQHQHQDHQYKIQKFHQPESRMRNASFGPNSRKGTPTTQEVQGGDFLDLGSSRSINIKNYGENFGFDDQYGNYVVVPRDHINYRYEIQRVLGNGSFGNVVKCKDHKYVSTGPSKTVAIKIIKNDLSWSLQAVYEIKMLKHLNECNKIKSPNLLNYLGHFHFRGHMCIVTETLSLNLFSLLEISSYKGFSLNILKQFSTQILRGLAFIHEQKIIHCDIKPENIMIKLPSLSSNTSEEELMRHLTIKIIDFGSSCFKNEVSYLYIQSRYYRAPEVVLGAKYNEMIDIWSFGCVVTELFSGMPLLPGKNELEQIGYILELFGSPSSTLIQSYRKIVLNSIEKGGKSASRVGDPINPTNDTIPAIPKIDEKSIKKTLLFTLFDLEGKINLQFLNLRLQALSQNQGKNSFTQTQLQLSKKNIKISSKVLEILLKTSTNNESKKDNTNFIKFLSCIFQWDPNVRSSASELLDSPFLLDN